MKVNVWKLFYLVHFFFFTWNICKGNLREVFSELKSVQHCLKSLVTCFFIQMFIKFYPKLKIWQSFTLSLQSFPRVSSKKSSWSHLKPKAFLHYLIFFLFAVYYGPMPIMLSVTWKNIDNLQIFFFSW